jgi:hypothetical protein
MHLSAFLVPDPTLHHGPISGNEIGRPIRKHTKSEMEGLT